MPWVNVFFKLPETDGYYKVKIRDRNGDWHSSIEVTEKVPYDFNLNPRWLIERQMPGVKVTEWFHIKPIKINLKFFNNITN